MGVGMGRSRGSSYGTLRERTPDPYGSRRIGRRRRSSSLYRSRAAGRPNQIARRPVRWTNRGIRETSLKASHGARTRSTLVERLGIGARTTRSIHAYAIGEASGRRSVRWMVSLDPLDFHAQSLDLGNSPLVV